MTNGEMAEVQEDMLKIKESLDVAMDRAGGAPLSADMLKNMTGLYLLSLLSTNNIRFTHVQEKKK